MTKKTEWYNEDEPIDKTVNRQVSLALNDADIDIIIKGLSRLNHLNTKHIRRQLLAEQKRLF